MSPAFRAKTAQNVFHRDGAAAVSSFSRPSAARWAASAREGAALRAAPQGPVHRAAETACAAVFLFFIIPQIGPIPVSPKAVLPFFSLSRPVFLRLCSCLLYTSPAPDIILRAIELLDCPPQECLVLEDSPNGIRAAHAAGAKPMMIPDLTQPDEELKKLLWAQGTTLLDVIPLLEDDRAGEGAAL